MRFISLALACFLSLSVSAFAQCNADCQCRIGAPCSCQSCDVPHVAESAGRDSGQCSLGQRIATSRPVRAVAKVAAVPVKAVRSVVQNRPVRTLLRGAFCGRRCR